MDNFDKSNPTTQGTVPSRTAQGLSDTASRMQQALDQISQLKQKQLQVNSSIKESKIDPTTSKQTDLDTLSFNEYQLKYGRNSDVMAEYVQNSMIKRTNPRLAKDQLERTRDDGSAGDFIADAALGVTSTVVNIVGGTVGGGSLVAADPLGAGVAAFDMAGELVSDFTGDDTNYEDLIIGNQGSTRSGHDFGKALDEVSDTFAEVSDTFAEVRNNVKEFLNTNGGLKQYPELAEGLKDDPILTKALETFGGATLEGTKALSDWIKSGQSESLKARTQLRNDENQAYANKLREELGEDAGWVDHVIKNSKLLGMSALNLVKDPTATLYTVIESSPYLYVSGVTSRIAGEVAFKKALKNKTEEITKKVNSEKLPHSNIPTLIGNELSKSMDGIIKIKEVTAAQAAILSTGVLEGTGAATEAYNLIIDTPYKTLEKSSERYRAMLLKEGLTQEEARKQLAIEYSMGNALAVGVMASSVSKMAGIDKAIKRTFGVTRTPSGTIPKSVSIAVDEGKEGIEELVQSFVSSAVTGITERENIDPNKDVYGEASIDAGEGFVAGVGTSGVFSGARVVLDGVNTASKGTKEYVAKNAEQVRKARSIKDNGTTPADLDPTHNEFNFVGSLEGIYRRNLQEGVTEQEIDKNINDANILINDYLDHIEKLNPIVDDQNVSQEVRDKTQAQIDKAKDDITKAFTTIEKMKVKQVDPTFEESLTKAKEGDSSAATRIMGNMRTNPDSVSDTDAQALIDSGSLNPQEQEVVQKHINYVKATKTLDEVKTDVMSGGKGFIGIQQYMNTIGSSLKVGNEAGAMKAFQGLKAFSARHNQKAKDFSEALAIAQTPNKTPEQIARLAEINELYPNTSRPDLDTIHRGSDKLVEQTGLEAVALLNAVELAEANIKSAESTPTETSTETEASTPVEQTEAVEEVTEASPNTKNILVKTVQDKLEELNELYELSNELDKKVDGTRFNEDQMADELKDFYDKIEQNDDDIAKKVLDIKDTLKEIDLSNYPEYFNEEIASILDESPQNRQELTEEQSNRINNLINDINEYDSKNGDLFSEAPVEEETSTEPEVINNAQEEVVEDVTQTEPVKRNNNTESLIKALDTLMDSTYDENSEEAYSNDITKVINELNSLTITDTRLSDEREDILNDIHGYIDEDRAEHIRDFVKDLNQQVESSNSMEDSDLPPWDTTEDVSKPVNAKQVLQEAIDNGLYAGKVRRIIAKAIVKFIPEHVTFQVVPADSEKLYNPNTKQYHPAVHFDVGEVYVSDALSKELQEEDLLHELIHSVLVPAYRGNGNKTPEQKKFIKEIQELYEYMVNQAKIDGISDNFEIAYGLSNVDEFLAMSMSNPRFMKWMKDTKIDSRSVFTKFAQAIAELLGLPKNSYSALEKLLDITDQVLNNEQVTESVQEEVQRTPEQVQAELDTALDNGDISSAATLANELDALDPQETITVLPRFAQGEYLNGVVPEQGTKVEEVEAASSAEERFKQYLSENLVSKYFRVRKGDTATKNPITEIKNLMETLAIRADDIIRAYTEEGDVTGKQKALIKSLTDHHNTFKKLFEDIFVPSYNKTDNLMEYFMDNNVMPEEVLAAMSSATFNWISTGSGSTLYNSYDDVKKLLGLDESDDLPPKIYNQLSSGVFEQTLAEEIGKNILKNLGLTSLSTSPSNYQTNLENSLGLMAVNVLFKQGFLVRKEFPSHLFYTGEVADRFEELQTKFETFNTKKLKEIGTKEALELRALILPVSTLYTATSKKDADGIPKLHPVLQNIVEANKDTNGLLSKLFRAESHRTGPSDEPVTEANPKVRNSDQDVASEYKDTIVKHNATEHYLKDAQVKAFNSLSVDAQRDMFGYVSDMSKIQQHNVDSVNSKNRAINASLNFYNEFTDGRNSDKPFFFNHELIKNERMLLVSNTFNPQGNKLHRHMTKIEGQDSTINLKDGDPTKTRNFLIAFGQSMGVKIDKMLNDDSVQIVLDLLGDPVVEDALNAIMNQEGDKYTAEQEAAILAAVKKGGEQAWSLDGLVAMAGYIQAKNNGEATFTHDLMVEADGITNGPAIGTLQFGIGNSLDDVVERLKKVGINPKGDTKEYGDYISQPTNKDNYESVTEQLNNEVSTLNAAGKRVADFGLFILGDLVKVNNETGEITFQRNISKGSLMTAIYGAGQKSIKAALSKSVIDGIYDYIQENQDDVGKLQLLKDQLEKNMGIKVDDSLLSAPLKFKLDFRAELNIKKGIENTLGTSMVNAIDILYGQFKEATTWINEAMGVVAETFQQMYAHAVAKREDEMVAEGLLARGRPTADNPKGAMLEKLPRSEERKILEELRKAQPIVNSVLSATKEDAVNEGLFVGKTKLSRAVGQQALQVRQKYSGIGRKTGSMFGSIREFISGGASPVVLMVQNIDATTMLRHLNEMVSFNVYDAIITGVDNIVGHTRNMNKHFYEINRDHDIGQEAKKAFERAEQAVKEYDAANGTNFAKEFNREKEISIGEGFTDIVVIREELDKAVEESTKRKERTMGIIGRMGQYGWEKAYFNVDGTIPNLVDNSIGSVTDEDIINRSLGNSPLGDQGDTQYKTSTQKKVDSMNVLDVFDEVGKLGNVRETAEHSAFLRDEINTLKGQLLNEVNLHLKDTLEDTIANVEGNDIYMYTQMFGGQKNSTAILNAGLRMSTQEALAHELWHTVSRHGIEGNSKAKKELTRRWEQAKNTLDPTIFMDDPTLPESSPEYKEAKEAFDYIFTPRVDKSTTTINPTTGKTETKYYSNHLHEFAAYARTNAKMIAALKTVKDDAKTDTQPRLDDGSFLNSIYNKVLDILAAVVDRLSVYLTNTKGLPQDQAVRELVKQLANIEATNKNRILNVVDTFDSSMGKLSGLVGTVAKKVNKPIIQIAESKFVKDNKSAFIRLPGRIVRILNDNAKAKYVLDAASNVQANLSKEKQGFSEQLITEARGLTNNLKSFHSLSRMKTKVIDGAVLELQSNLKTIFNKMFESVEPTDKDMEAVTRAFLKTDLSSLGLDLNKVLELVSNPAKVDADIKLFEAPLRKDPNWNHFELQTKALGYFMATGKVTTSNLNFNAKQISQLFGTGKFNVNAAKAEKNIDMLTTLYALKYTDPAYKQRLTEFLRKNLAQGSSNGMNFLQEFHREQKKKDLEQVFQGSEVNYMKGHVREEFDPNISVVIAGPEEGAEYEARGWVKTELMKDPDDPVNSSMHMYVDTHGGETRTIGSIISFTSKQSRGTDTIKRRQVIGDNAPVYSGGRDTAVIFKRKERSYKTQLANSSTFDPTKAATGMAPMYDLNGEITGYRYMMNEKTKDKVLKRDTNAINVLSKGAASTLNKVETVAFNKQVIQATKDHFDANPDGNFLAIGPGVQDPELREIYARLPKEAKQSILDVWGNKTMFVDRRTLTMLFGYRKYSLADELAKDKMNQSYAIQFLGAVNSLLGKPFGYSAEQIARTTGQYWQEYVSIAKDFLIIKSGIVTMVNAISNSTQLWTEGLSATEILKSQKEAVVELAKYREQSAELFELEKIVELGIEPAKEKANKVRIARLKAEISANPVTDVINDGLLQNIVEDVSLVDDQFTKGGKIKDAIDIKLLTKVPGFVREGAREVFQTKDSYLYKKMSQSAQLSDFMARYALYKHSVGKEGLSREDAANKAISTFINYDLPTHRGIQYLNDMGVLWFTKYYIRIQKILLKTFINKPGRVISLLLMDFMTGDSVSTVYDSYLSTDNVLNRTGLPDDPIDLLGNLATASVI